MNQPSLVSLNASRGALLLNLKQPMFVPRQLLQLSRRREEETYFVNYIPPARDSLTLPRNVVYVLIGLVLVIVATYAIVGHLIKDLMHDMADWILGPKPVEDESEEGRAEIEEEQRLSVSSKLMQKDRLEMEIEKDGQLPGIHFGDSFHCLPIPPPLSNAISPSYPEEKNVTAHRMSFSSPLTPYVMSL